MKKFIKNILEQLSLRPYKTVELETGIIIKHYRSGNIRVD